jgi:hypothetical protein
MAKKVYIDFQLRFKGALEEIQELQSELVKQVSDLRGQYNDLNKKVDKYEDSVKESSKSTKKATGATVAFGGALTKLTGGATAAFVAMKAGLVSTIAGFKTLKVAVMSSGIGLLAVAIISVIQAFKRSEKGQQKFRKMMMVLGAVTDIFMDSLAKLGMMIIEVFESPMKVIRPVINLLTSFKDTLIDVFTSPLKYLTQLKDAIVENITMRFEALMASAGFLGEALSELFAGNFRAAMRAGGKAVSKLGDAVTGVEDSFQRLEKATISARFAMMKGIISTEQYRKVLDSAADAADKLSEAEVLGRDLIIKRAEADRDRADLLEKSVNKELFTVKQRIEFLKEAAALEEEITNQEIEAARLRLEAHQLEMEGTLDTTEALQKEAELKAELIQLETARLTKQKEVTSQIVAFNAEAKAENDALIAEAKAEEKERTDEFLANNVYVFGVGFMPKDQYDQMLADAKQREKEEADRQAQIRKTEEEFREKNLQDTFDLESQRLENEKKKKLAELDLLKATEKEKEEVIKFYDNRITDAKKKEEEQRNKNQEEILQQGIANVISIVGANSKFGKGIAAANAIRDTFAGANKALAQGGIFGFISAAAIIASGLKNVKTILGTEDPAPPAGIKSSGGTSEPAINVPSASAPSLPPQFDTVGASGTNQLAQLLGGEQAPVRAFVVSGDVSTAQEMDRNIVSSASLG